MKQKEQNFSELLDEVLNSVTLDEVIKNGTVIDKKETGYLEEYHDADSSGGMWKRAELWEYNGKRYMVAYKCVNFPFDKKECIKFSEYTED